MYKTYYYNFEYVSHSIDFDKDIAKYHQQDSAPADHMLIKKQMILLSYVEQFSSLHKGHSWKPTWCYLLKALESKLKMSYLAQKDGRNFFIL